METKNPLFFSSIFYPPAFAWRRINGNLVVQFFFNISQIPPPSPEGELMETMGLSDIFHFLLQPPAFAWRRINGNHSLALFMGHSMNFTFPPAFAWRRINGNFFGFVCNIFSQVPPPSPEGELMETYVQLETPPLRKRKKPPAFAWRRINGNFRIKHFNVLHTTDLSPRLRLKEN